MTDSCCAEWSNPEKSLKWALPFDTQFSTLPGGTPTLNACGMQITVHYILTVSILYCAVRAVANFGGALRYVLAYVKASVTRVLKFLELSGL